MIVVDGFVLKFGSIPLHHFFFFEGKTMRIHQLASIYLGVEQTCSSGGRRAPCHRTWSCGIWFATARLQSSCCAGNQTPSTSWGVWNMLTFTTKNIPGRLLIKPMFQWAAVLIILFVPQMTLNRSFQHQSLRLFCKKKRHIWAPILAPLVGKPQRWTVFSSLLVLPEVGRPCQTARLPDLARPCQQRSMNVITSHTPDPHPPTPPRIAYQ